MKAKASHRHAEDSRSQFKRPRRANHSPSTAKRVGGGYEISSPGSNEAAAQQAAASAGALLQGLQGPLSEHDLLIIRHILKTAEHNSIEDFQSGRANSSHITLAKLLQAYDVVLPQHGILPQEDAHYYRILLKLTLDPNHDWWQRFQREKTLWSRRHSPAAMPGSRHRSLASHSRAAAVARCSAGGKTRSRSASVAAAAAAPAAMHAAAVAVDAATAAMAAAWADARVHGRSNTAAAMNAAALAEASRSFPLQEQCSLESWQVMQADPSACCRASLTGHGTALSGHDARLSEAVADAINCTAGCSRRQPVCPDLSSLAQHQADAGCLQHSSSSWHASLAVRPRAASAASLHSSCCGCTSAALQDSNAAAGAQGGVQQRLWSPSECTGMRRSNSEHLPTGIGRPSSSSGVVHEFPCSGCCGMPCACSCDAVARPQPALNSTAAPTSGAAARDVLSAAVLAAGQRDRLWKCLELHSSPAGKAALQQLQHNWPQQQVAAGVATEQELQDELSAGQLPAGQLQRYCAFVSYMAIQHNWRARALSAHISGDALAAAEQLLQLALSFWQVHAAWRCFARWRQLAAAAAETSRRHHNQWLLLCSFQWWHRMARHYHRQQQPAGVQPPSSPLQRLQDISRPSSPLTGLSRLLQQHPNLRPPCSPAGEMRQQACGRVLAAHTFAIWLGVAQSKAQQRQLQEQLAWHHVQHVQARVWNKWRTVFEQCTPQHKLLTTVYRARRHSTLSKVLKRWRVWAPVKHAKRRRLRDALVTLHRSKRRRVLISLRDYTGKRRVKGVAKQRAQQHFRRTCLVKFLAYWLHALDIAAAFDELADTCWSKLLQRHSQAMLVWWRQWVAYKQHQQELLDSSCCHMNAYTVHRCVAAWQGRVMRKHQLQDLLQEGLTLSARMAAKTAFRAWLQRTEEHRRHASIVLTVAASCKHRLLVAVWLSWLEYVCRRQQQQQDYHELCQRNQLFVWHQHITSWQGLLHQKFRLWKAVATLQSSKAKCCVQHWKAWVDRKADWAAFQARATQRITSFRLAAVLRLWCASAHQQAMLRELLAGFLQRHQLRLQQQALAWWRQYLMRRVAKRMNELSALLQWEQCLTRKAVRVWQGRTAVWRYKRQQRIRADSYRALRLLDLALTSWSSLWAEGQEFAQKAAFFLAGKQAELRVLVLRAWGPEAARQRLKRERVEIARMHCIVTRQQQVVTAWRAEASKRLRLRQLMGAAVQRWSQLTASRAFQQWKDWALHQASLHRRMRAVVSMLMGRTLQWAFCMIREHALRKRRSRSARHHWQRHVAAAALRAWHQLAADGAFFRAVLQGVGRSMQKGLLSETFQGWRDVLRAKQWKAANMMRALMLWGGSKKHLCFQTWRQWVQLKQGKKASLRQALRHWQHSYMTRALSFWQYYTQRKQVSRHVLEHFRSRYLSAAFSAWHAWWQRKTYLAAVFAQLQGKGHQQVMQVVWNAWRSFVPQAQDKRQAKGRAAAHWHKRALVLAFAWWCEYTVTLGNQRRLLAAALMRWDTRRLYVALEGWQAVASREKHRQERLVQGLGRRRLLVLSACFRGWRQEVDLQLYRRHVIVVIGSKVNNGLLLKAFTCWRHVADSKQQRRQRLVSALTAWWASLQHKTLQAWLQLTREAVADREADSWRQQRLLSYAFTALREYGLLQQQHSLITRMVTNKRVNRTLLAAWTAWREVVDLNHQVTSRLRAVAQGWQVDKLWLSFDAWRQWAVLKKLGRLTVQHRAAKQQASCWAAWRVWAAEQRSAKDKVTAVFETRARRLAAAIMREWLAVSWLAPREQRAGAFATSWLLRRSLIGWRQWLHERRRWKQLGDSLAARWTNLHMEAAWQAWRAWVHRRRQKAELASSVAKRWNNLHLAAAFQAWAELVQVARHHKAAVQTIAGRWRNLHTAAAFGAWRSFLAQRKRHRTAASAVAARWNNLHLAIAFRCWQLSVADSAGFAAAADEFAARQAAALTRAAFMEWCSIASRKARLQRQAAEVSGRQQRLYKELAYGGWKEVVQWRAAKHAADAHWRQVVLRSLVGLWYQRAQQRAGYQKTAAVVRGRTHQQLMRRSLISWQLFVKHRRQKATADAYASGKLQQQMFLAWVQVACQARSKADAAINMGVRVQASLHNHLVLHCFTAWHTSAKKSAAFRGVVLQFSTRRLRMCLLAWQQAAHMLAGAARLLRRLLAVTVRGAFQEWRTVARERAHWHRVEEHLLSYLRGSRTGAGARATAAVLRWSNPLLWAAWNTWRQCVASQVQERTNELKASKFLELALALKALTGLKWAVQEGRVDRAAASHRGGAVKRAVLRGWHQVALYLQEKQQKSIAAAYAWSTKTKHKAMSALLAYAQFRVTRSQQTVAARHHFSLTRKAGVLAAWRSLARYLRPIRQALDVMTSKRQRRSRRQLFAGWRLVCHQASLLRMAVGRRRQRTLAACFSGWRSIVEVKVQNSSLLHVAIARLNNIQLARAFTRWAEAAQELKALRAKAQQVLRKTLQRRMRGALVVWQGYVEYCDAKRAMVAVADRHCHQLYAKHSMQAWSAFIKEARQFAALSEQLLMQRQQKQRGVMLLWWRLIAQDLHHHRAVLQFFRARHVRQGGLAVFKLWLDWAHWRGMERRAIMAHWHKIMLLAFATWKQHHGDVLQDRAVAHDMRRHSARALTAWQLGLALIHRKRSLTAAAVLLCKAHRVQRSMRVWLRFTYYKHMGHVALHFRVRRLACIVLREWQQAAALRVEERSTAQLLMHQFAVSCASRVLTGWQHMLHARAYWRRRNLEGCLRYWAYWAPVHRARNAGWRSAAQTIAVRKLGRCFYCWRWYCQVRLLREVAFQNKQRAIREALVVGEQVARRRRAALLAASFMVWHIQVNKYRAVAQKLAGLLHRNLSTCFRSWREATDQARVQLLRAQRHHQTNTLSNTLPAWQEAAAEAREQRWAAEAAADKMQRRQLLSAACRSWVEEMAVVHAQRQGLWQLLLMLLSRERQQLLQAALEGWRAWVQDRVALRTCIAGFVNKRRLACLCEFLTLWQQYTAAMRGAKEDGAAAASVLLHQSLTPAPRAHSPGFATAGCHTWPGGPAGVSSLPASAVCSPPRAVGVAGLSASPVLPVSAGPGSPLLGPRSAQQDRRLARRLVAMGGGAAEVDVGSDDEQQLLAGLPPTEAALSAAERQSRQQPLLELSRGYRQRRVTLCEGRRQYDDDAEAAREGLPSPHWDLHSVAESMQKAHNLGLSPWQLPSVHSSPPPKQPHPDSLDLQQLHSYQQRYPYSLQQQWQLQHDRQQQQQLEQQQLLRVSQQLPIGRPASAGAVCDYQPLLQQQLDLHDGLLLSLQQQPLPWQQAELARWHAAQQQQPVDVPPAAPWHAGGPRWQSPTAAIAATGIHREDRRARGRLALLPADSTTGSSRGSSSPSSTSALAGSSHDMQHHQQLVDMHEYRRWADKACKGLSKGSAAAAHDMAKAPQLPSFKGQVLPSELASLLAPCSRARHTA